jgi:NAD dependent epimerase/dehydratase family enzyme
MQCLRKATGHAIGLPAYKWMLKMGSLMIGTEAELVLKSRWVLPARLIKSGFVFKYPFLKDALDDIITRVPRKQYQLF